MYLSCCLYGAVRSGFKGDKSITRAILEGEGGLKIKTFLGPEKAASVVGCNDFVGGKSISRAIERGGP